MTLERSFGITGGIGNSISRFRGSGRLKALRWIQDGFIERFSKRLHSNVCSPLFTPLFSFPTWWQTSMQYCGECSGLLGDIISNAWGYHYFFGGCSVLWEDTIYTGKGYHQYCGGMTWVLWRLYQPHIAFFISGHLWRQSRNTHFLTLEAWVYPPPSKVNLGNQKLDYAISHVNLLIDQTNTIFPCRSFLTSSRK